MLWFGEVNATKWPHQNIQWEDGLVLFIADYLKKPGNMRLLLNFTSGFKNDKLQRSNV